MRGEESSILSTLLFCLLIYLFTTETEAREVLQQTCSSSCGDIKNISYPFRLKGDPSGCGYPEFELSCQSNQTILELFNSAKYYVKRISYDESTISVADVNLANGSCGLPFTSFPREIFRLKNSRYFFYTDRVFALDYYKYLYAYFVNCSRDLIDQAFIRVPCLSGGNQSNVYVNYHGSYVSDFSESCSFVSMVPVHNGNVENPSYETLRELLETGFDLRWSVGCRNCYAAAGRECISTDRTGNIDCFDSSSITNIFAGCHIAQGVFGKFICYQQLLTRNKLSYKLPPLYGRLEWLLLDGAFVYLTITRFILGSTVLLVFLIHKYRTTLKTIDNIEKFLRNQQSWMPKRYSYPQIIAMTNHFTHKLGQGGFGSVYKGQLQTGGLIAVKMLENSKFSAEEFINEVSTIGRIHHVNVVQLLGFCSEGSKRALVYEYMPNGSLDRHIFPKESRGQSLCWEKLHEVALGTARGIEYLHNGCDVCILHFDIKPHNILLDHNFIPKVSDFGLAKFHPKENDFVSISATRGTIGYIAPELISRNFGTVSCKSDVYGFGMVLLEMAGGRRNSNMNATRSSKAYFPSWVYDQLNKGGDLELQNVTEIESMIARKLCMIGLWCIQVKAADRPSMTKVLEMLEGSIDDLQMPPRPFFSSSRHISGTGREIESDSSAELLVSESMEECSFNDSYV
ncbi:rust resistance kinase Lr10 isoform X1 [Citrus clementina]|uniref:rust resistance kinase Lr10 isoform X1 n=1 Tax=Citrus clementina TaxID=85681 RepID=UPI000CED46CB|nr:rust resistance kinase Lr10 isoform X1 [Citrus x clementina]